MIWIIGTFIPRLLSVVIKVHGITLPPFIFMRTAPGARDLVHEEIHGKQTVETVLALWPVLTIVGLYFGHLWFVALAPILALVFHLVALYGGMWALGCVVLLAGGMPIGLVGSASYRSSPLEREAYDNEGDVLYLATRRPFAWVWMISGAWTLP